MVNHLTYTAVRSSELPPSEPSRDDSHGHDRTAGSSSHDSTEVRAINESIYPPVSGDACKTPPKNLPEHIPHGLEPEHVVRWGIHWLVPAKMLSLFLAGIVMAIGHHMYYGSLAHNEVSQNDDNTSQWNLDRQEWKIRFGTAFAFLTKTLLAAAIAIAYKQHAWATCRRKSYSVSGLDALFSATTDVLAFANLDFTLRAKLSSLLAVLVWLLPLSALVSPATLTVVSVHEKNNAIGPVPQLDLSPTPPYSGFASSQILTRISSATASSMGLLAMPSQGRNTSYVMEFIGPSLSCEEPNPNLLGLIDQVVEYVQIRQFRQLPGKLIYTAFTPSAYIFGSGPTDDNTTRLVEALGEACVLGGTSCQFTPGELSIQTGDNITHYGRNDPLVMRFDKSYTCALKNTKFSVRFKSTAEQTTLDLMSYSWDDTDPSFNKTYAAIGMSVANILTGAYSTRAQILEIDTVSDVAREVVATRTSIEGTAMMGPLIEQIIRDPDFEYYAAKLLADPAMAQNKTIGELVEDFSRNVTLSLFSDPRFWSSTLYLTEITSNTQINRYAYNARNFWLAYGIAIAVTFFSICIGFCALFSNGISYEMSFSTIVATSRNQMLDGLMAGSSLGADPMDSDILRTRLRFGILDGSYGEDVGENVNLKRAGFGLEAQVRSLDRKELCC